jgi:hypothetical protein
MTTPPDQTHPTALAATTLGPSERPCARSLEAAHLPDSMSRGEDPLFETMRGARRKLLPAPALGNLTPGIARVSTIAAHWAVHEDTARALLAERGGTPPEEGVDLYAWEDVWRIEGAGYVPPSRFADYREDMIAVETLGRGSERDRARGLTRRGLVELGPSALRDRLTGIAAPLVRLGPRITRVRPCDLPALLELLRKRKVRRRPAAAARTTPDRGG